MTHKISSAIAFLLLICGLLSSCKKNDVPAPVIPPVILPVIDTLNVAQYGTPFNKVPDPQNIVMYQVNMRVFSQKGDFAGVTARLDEIKALGTNVIYIMPIHPIGVLKSINSPYCIRDHAAIGNEFGTLADLRALVDGAHSKGMAVIMDWLANFTAWDHKWITAHPDWFVMKSDGTIASSPYIDVAPLDFNKQGLRLAQISIMKYWVKAANIDGFRCDYSDGPPESFWKQAIDSLRNIKTHKLIMMAEGTRTSNFTVGFDLNFGFHFFDNLKDIFTSNKSVHSINDINNTDYTNASDANRVVRYTTNHDVNSSDGVPQNLFGGIKGSMGAFITAAYMKGVPMIYNGQEVATSYRLRFPFTSEKIDWTVNPKVTEDYKKVIALYNASNAIRRGTLANYSTQDICAFSKVQGTEKVLVISNFRNQTIDYSLPAAVANATWTDALNGGTLQLGTKISILPYDYLVLKQ